MLCDKPAELLGQYHAFLLDVGRCVENETKNAVFFFFFVNAFAARLKPMTINFFTVCPTQSSA